MKNRSTFHQVLETLRGEEELTGIHLEPSRGSDEENEKYCKKDGNAVSAGKYKEEREKKDASDYMQTIVDYILAEECFDEETLYSKFGKHYLKQGRQAISLARGIMSSRKRKSLVDDMDDTELKPWQSECVNLLSAQNDRQILWVIDPVGGAGKTFLCKQLVAQLNAFYTTSTNSRDVACAYNGENYVIFDLTRESRLKVAHGPTKVLVMINKEPDLSKLSRDRWHTMRLEGSTFQVTNRCMEVKTRREEIKLKRERAFAFDDIIEID
jgi:hypothetical protein